MLLVVLTNIRNDKQAIEIKARIRKRDSTQLKFLFARTMNLFGNVQVKHAVVAISTTVSTILLAKAFQRRKNVLGKIFNLIKHICFAGDATDSTPECDCCLNSNCDFGLCCQNLSYSHDEYLNQSYDWYYYYYYYYCYYPYYCYYIRHHVLWYNRIYQNYKRRQLQRHSCCHCKCTCSQNISNANLNKSVCFFSSLLFVLFP